MLCAVCVSGYGVCYARVCGVMCTCAVCIVCVVVVCMVPHTHTGVTLLLPLLIPLLPLLLLPLLLPQVRNGVVGLISKGQAMIAPLQAQASEQYSKVAAQIEPTIAKVRVRIESYFNGL